MITGNEGNEGNEGDEGDEGQVLATEGGTWSTLKSLPVPIGATHIPEGKNDDLKVFCFGVCP